MVRNVWIIVILVVLVVVGVYLFGLKEEREPFDRTLSPSDVDQNIADDLSAEVTQINRVALSEDNKSILNAETGDSILSLEEVNNFSRDISAEPAHYGSAQCLANPSLSPNRSAIVFSTGCTPGSLSLTFIGLYLADSGEVKMLVQNAFGSDFVWSDDVSQITFTNTALGSGLSERVTISATDFLQTLPPR